MTHVPSLQCVVSRHCQVEARLADVGLHAVNRLARGGADHLGIKQLDDVWNRSGRKNQEKKTFGSMSMMKSRSIFLELNILLANVITSSNEP